MHDSNTIAMHSKTIYKIIKLFYILFSVKYEIINLLIQTENT